jgi:methylenetetrahydrofolate dehydrogenase (NADP+)/methenyltetrahydrofolate cyclohydrolase
MIADGKQLARDLEARLAEEFAALPKKPSVALFVMSEDLATRTFINIKKKVAERLGITVRQEDIPAHATTEEVIDRITNAAEEGIVVQLPLAAGVDTAAVLAAIPRGKDLDVISPDANAAFSAGDFSVLPPVVGAIAAILERYAIDPNGKQVAVIGSGKLVGKPAAAWLSGKGASVAVADEHTPDISVLTKNADMIVLGAGEPGLLTPAMINEGVVILDAGTSEASGKLAGDADPTCAEKASLFTPVPGGIGPLTVVMLFQNLLSLAKKNTPAH